MHGGVYTIKGERENTKKIKNTSCDMLLLFV